MWCSAPGEADVGVLLLAGGRVERLDVDLVAPLELDAASGPGSPKKTRKTIRNA